MKKKLSVVAVAAGLMTALVGTAHAKFPEKPITIVVPFGAGGGSDTLMRSIQKVIKDKKLLPVPLVIQNVGGAGSSIGTRRAAGAPADGYTYLFSHFAMLGAMSTKVLDFGLEKFDPVLQITEKCLLYTVQKGAKWKTLKEFFEEAKASPGKLKEAINIGAVVHVTSWMLTDAYGGDIKLRYVQAGGGAKRFPALVGGHVDAAQFSASEFATYGQKGIRALAYAGPSRHPNLPNVPTAKEQGADVTACINDWFFAPAGTPPAAAKVFADAVIAAVKTDGMQALLKKKSTDTIILTGDALKKKVQADYDLVKSVAARHLDELAALKAARKKKK